MLKITKNNDLMQIASTVSALRPVTAAKARVAQFAQKSLDAEVEVLHSDVTTGETDQNCLEKCSRAVSRYEEGDIVGASIAAWEAIEECPPGKALHLLSMEEFAQCLDICIDSAKFYAEEMLAGISGDPYAGTLPKKLDMESRLATSRFDVALSFTAISVVAAALGGKPAEVLAGMATMRELVPNAGLSQLASDAGRLLALCNLAESCIVEKTECLAEGERAAGHRLSGPAPNCLVADIRECDAPQSDVFDLQGEEGL